MNEIIIKEALEAIVAIEKDSPAAFDAAKLIAQETLNSLDADTKCADHDDQKSVLDRQTEAK